MNSSEIEVKKQEVLDFIAKSTLENGYAPSVREICDEAGFSSTATGQKYLDELQQEGLLTSIPGKARTWKVVNQSVKSKEGWS